MAPKMPCHISDGPQEPGDVGGFQYLGDEDGDEAYDRHRQQCIDDRVCHNCATDLDEHGACPACNAKCVVCNIEWVDVHNGEDTCRGCLSSG